MLAQKKYNVLYIMTKLIWKYGTTTEGRVNHVQPLMLITYFSLFLIFQDNLATLGCVYSHNNKYTNNSGTFLVLYSISYTRITFTYLLNICHCFTCIFNAVIAPVLIPKFPKTKATDTQHKVYKLGIQPSIADVSCRKRTVNTYWVDLMGVGMHGAI